MNGSKEPRADEKGRNAAERRIELLQARLDRILTPEETAELDRILAADPAAAADGRAFDQLARLARAARVHAPDDLAARVLAALPARRIPVTMRILAALRRFCSPARLARPVFAQVLAAVVLAVLLVTLTLKPRGRSAPDDGNQTAAQSVAHLFEFSDPGANKVCLVGDFNNWKVCEAPLHKDETTGRWTVQLALPPGRHEYMFVVDGSSWVTDPAAPVSVDDGFGNQNAVLFL
jgi:hypothetical protein